MSLYFRPQIPGSTDSYGSIGYGASRAKLSKAGERRAKLQPAPQTEDEHTRVMKRGSAKERRALDKARRKSAATAPPPVGKPMTDFEAKMAAYSKRLGDEAAAGMMSKTAKKKQKLARKRAARMRRA